MGDFIYNGKLYREGTVVVSAGNRGLRYGDGLFETIKMQEGKLVLKDAHFARLWKGMSVLGFDMPKHFTPEKLVDETAALAKKNGHEKNGRIRLQVFRGDGGLYDAVNHSPNYIIETAELAESYGQLNSNGLVLGIYTGVKKSCDMVSNLKHNNYLPYVMAALHAKKEKWDDAIVLNSYDNICDSTIANIFIIKNEEVCTPPLSQGCVAGVMREHLVQILKPTAWKVKETILTADDILHAKEVFLTNSMYNMRWVKSTGSAGYTNSIIQKIYALLLPTIM